MIVKRRRIAVILFCLSLMMYPNGFLSNEIRAHDLSLNEQKIWIPTTPVQAAPPSVSGNDHRNSNLSQFFLSGGSPLSVPLDPVPFEIRVDPAVRLAPVDFDADDMAIWTHPEKIEKSFIVGNDKGGGIYVWDLDGNILQVLEQDAVTNNIDLRKNIALGEAFYDVVVANLRSEAKLAVFIVNPDYDPALGNVLIQLTDKYSEKNDVRYDSYGLSLYRRPEDGALFVFDRPKFGRDLRVRQYRIGGDPENGLTVTPVRDLRYFGTNAEGMVVDDETGLLYVVEETVGVHTFYADPDKPSHILETFGRDGGIVGYREGIALYKGPYGGDFVLVASIGDGKVKVYELEQDHRFVMSIDTQETTGTDGIDVTPVAVPGMPQGFLVQHNTPGKDFKIYDWGEIIRTAHLGKIIQPSVFNPSALSVLGEDPKIKVSGGNKKSGGIRGNGHLHEKGENHILFQYNLKGSFDSFAQADLRFKKAYTVLKDQLTLALKGPLGIRADIQITDYRGKTAAYTVVLDDQFRNYSLNLWDEHVPQGFARRHIKQIRVLVDRAHVGEFVKGTVEVRFANLSEAISSPLDEKLHTVLDQPFLAVFGDNTIEGRPSGYAKLDKNSDSEYEFRINTIGSKTSRVIQEMLFVNRATSLPDTVIFGLNVPQGKNLIVHIEDISGKVAEFLITGAGKFRNYNLNLKESKLPEGFDRKAVRGIRFLASAENVGREIFWVQVKTKGLQPLITPAMIPDKQRISTFQELPVYEVRKDIAIVTGDFWIKRSDNNSEAKISIQPTNGPVFSSPSNLLSLLTLQTSNKKAEDGDLPVILSLADESGNHIAATLQSAADYSRYVVELSPPESRFNYHKIRKAEIHIKKNILQAGQTFNFQFWLEDIMGDLALNLDIYL